MTFEVDLNGRVRSVSVEPSGERSGRFRVTLDRQTRVFDVIRSGDHRLLLLEVPHDEAGTARSDGDAPVVAHRVHEVQVSPGAAGDVLITLAGRCVAATVNGRRIGHPGEAGAHAHGEQSVIAPMPGRVVRVLVAAGDEVAAKQPLVVVEAMKMENELRATRAGRVKEVSATPGTSVEAGRVLVVIE
jgi:biotin carboxyl carrier protein